MESNRVPKVGELWGYPGGVPVVITRDDIGWLTSGKASRAWTYISGPSDAPEPKAGVCGYKRMDGRLCNNPWDSAIHACNLGPRCHCKGLRNDGGCHPFVTATDARIKQAAVAGELEKRAKDIPSVKGGGSPRTSPGSVTEAARGGEAAVSRPDTMAHMTRIDVVGIWDAIESRRNPIRHCNLGVACNVCNPPVKRVPWVDSLPVDWWLPDAV